MSFGYDNGVIYDIGQAFVIFKKSEAAESVVRKLDEGCLLMSNGRYVLNSM